MDSSAMSSWPAFAPTSWGWTTDGVKFQFRRKPVEGPVNLLAEKILIEKIHHCGPIVFRERVTVLRIIHARPALRAQHIISGLSAEH